MYTPLKFLDQIKNGIYVPGLSGKQIEELNTNYLNFAERLNKDRDKYYGPLGIVDSWGEDAINVYSEELKVVHGIIKEEMEYTGLRTENICDTTCGLLNAILYSDFSKMKKCYKIEPSLFLSLQRMAIPNLMPTDAIAKLPAKCFYIDYNCNDAFSEGNVGCFVSAANYNDGPIFNICNIIEHERLMFMRTTLCVQDAYKSSRFHFDINVEEYVDAPLEDGTSVHFKNFEFVNFFINFLLYLQAANRDVEYTPLTKEIYKKPKPGATPKNKMREVEQFGVGFRYAQTISPQMRAKYIYMNSEDKEKKTQTQQKRKYASTYRSAHWQRFWTGSGENKKAILKWVDGVFVKGNYESPNVVVHKVTEG